MFGVARQTVPLCAAPKCRLVTNRFPTRSTNPRALLGTQTLKVQRGGMLRVAAVAEDVCSEPNIEPQTAGKGPGNPGGRGGSSGGNNWNDDEGHDEGHYFGGWIVFFLAGAPYVIEGLRKLSFGSDGIRILDLPAEPGMYKPVFAAAALGSTSLSALPPVPPPQKMSDNRGISLLGVVALLAACAGGYYIYSRRKRGSLAGSPMNDEEIQMEGLQAQNIGTRDLDPSMFFVPGNLQGSDASVHMEAPVVTPEAQSPEGSPMNDEEIQMEGLQAQNIGTRDLDPSMFYVPGNLQGSDASVPMEAPVVTPEAQSPEDVSQVLPDEPALENPVLESPDAEDGFVGKTQSQPIPSEPFDTAPASLPSHPAVPAIVADTKQLSPEEVVQDNSSNQSSILKQDTRDGNIYADDLPSKDNFFGVQTEENEEPQTKEIAEPETKPELPTEDNVFESNLDMKDGFMGTSKPDVVILVEPAEEIGTVTLPISPSPCLLKEQCEQATPDKVVKVHDSTPHSEILVQDTRPGNVLETDLSAKDEFFRPASKSIDAERHSIIDEVANPIIKDIAKELEDDVGGEPKVQVQMQSVGSYVNVSIKEFQGEDTPVTEKAAPIQPLSESETPPLTTSSDVDLADTSPEKIIEAHTEDFIDASIVPVIDSIPPSKYGPGVDIPDPAAESRVGKKYLSKLGQSADSLATAKPDASSPLVMPCEYEGSPQKTILVVKSTKSRSPILMESLANKAVPQKTVPDVGTTAEPVKSLEKKEEKIDANAGAEAPTTPTKESGLETLTKSPDSNDSEGLQTEDALAEDKRIDAHPKGSEDSSGSHDEHGSGSGGKGNSGTTSSKKRRKKRGKKNKSGKTNMH